MKLAPLPSNHVRVHDRLAVYQPLMMKANTAKCPKRHAQCIKRATITGLFQLALVR